MGDWGWLGVAGWYLGVNAWAFLAFLWDKRAAGRGARRVRERTLLGLVWVGGFVGGFAGMRAARHKMRKWVFRVTPVAALALHAGAWWWLAWRAGP